jgi:hypothetical protein
MTVFGVGTGYGSAVRILRRLLPIDLEALELEGGHEVYEDDEVAALARSGETFWAGGVSEERLDVCGLRTKP